MDEIKTYQVDMRERQALRGIKKAFEDQKEAIKAMAFRPHDASCKDNLACTTHPCFIWEPDKIVNYHYDSDEYEQSKSVKAHESAFLDKLNCRDNEKCRTSDMPFDYYGR
jgi:hypothetical protein